MSGHPSNKFPYLILQNIGGGGDRTDNIRSPNSRNRDCSKSPRPGNLEARPQVQVRNKVDGCHQHPAPQGGLAFSQDYASTLREAPLTRPQLSSFLSSNGQNQFSAEFNQALNSISISQMTAILTAQKELRKPAGSLYPSASQYSLIPETELIYKKYFPNDDKEPENVKMSSKPKLHYAEIDTKSGSNGNEQLKPAKGSSGVRTGSNAAVSGSNNVKSPDSKKQQQQENRDSTKYDSISGDPVSIKAGASKDAIAAESRFRRRVHQQLLSISGEIERQGAELADLRTEVKELRQATRKNATDSDSSKARLATLSKHVVELDGKLDTLQDSISNQEKSILSKLMLIGDMSDTDSDMDDAGTLKGLDALSSPSSTKISFTLNGQVAKRTTSAPSCSTTEFSLPKSCCNWIPIAPDFDKLLQAVALLNYRMDRNQSMKLCTTNNGATFKHSDVVDLTLFKNGMILGSTGFRSYSTMSVIRFVNEIFNGYLPTELSTQYPDGVVIVLTDKRSVVHSNDVGFNSSGSQIMSKDDPPDLLPGKALFRKRSPSYSTVSSSVISSSVPSLTHISSLEMLPELKLGEGIENYGRKSKVVTLKINDRKNGRKYKLKVPTNATVRAVTDHLGAVLKEKNGVINKISSNDDVGGRPGSPKPRYNLILPVPLGKLSCLESTLEDYGISQNTLVYLQESSS